MRDEQKREAREFFSTPLIFSIQEVKGLEYKNVILYNFISSSTREFNEIIVDVTPEDLNRPDNFIYSRRKDKGDKSLEVYKFFINSLYVAITRSVQNLYWIESAYKHGIFKLLGTDKTQEKIQLEETTSNLGDWKKEADKLELQGKTEQAEEIRKNILKMGPVSLGHLYCRPISPDKKRGTGSRNS